jgi:branched-chain amino acid aminotransferase
VASIDDRLIGDGKPGPVSARLRERFRAVASGADPAFAHWLHLVGPG